MAVNQLYRAEYGIWANMKCRCTNENHEVYHNYGGRGIKVCNRWLFSFKNFLQDMGFRPSSKHTLDRIDNNGNYEPSNCRWVLMKQQQRNRRNNHLLTFNGLTLTVSEWAEKTGINKRTILERIKQLGWSVEKTLNTPARVYRTITNV